MKTYVHVKKAFFIGALALLLGLPLYSQISIEWNEIPHAIGTHWSKNFAYDVSVNLGTAGGPQTWTFTSQPMGPDSCTNIVVPVSQAPFHDSFPSANLVYASLEGSDLAYLYMQLETSFLSTLGIVGPASSGGLMRYNPADTNDLPEHFNDSRHYYTSWTVRIDSTTYFVLQKRGFEHINAYGTVNIPYGSFPCLRFILHDTLTQTMYYNGIPIFFDTTTRILHQFVAENYSGVVCVVSQNDETNPYFTNASILERLTYFVTGIEETGNVISIENSVRINPNPFNRNVTFAWSNGVTGSAKLEIFDAQGRLIRTFDASNSSVVSIMWNGESVDGTAVPDGVYFYRIMSGSWERTGKLVLMR